MGKVSVRLWASIIEADDRLRSLERSAGHNIPALKRYIRELQRSVGTEKALIELVTKYKVLPDVGIHMSFYSEEQSVEGSTTFASIVRWTERELAKGNMYAWCQGVLRVSWMGRYSDQFHLGGISAKNEKEAEETLLDHGLATEAATDLVNDWPNELDMMIRGMGTAQKKPSSQLSSEAKRMICG